MSKEKTKYEVQATLKRLYDSLIIEETEEFATDIACIAFVKELNTNRCWKRDNSLQLIGKPVIICR
jgi:hypothetical protein